jgi:hypothetical protein
VAVTAVTLRLAAIALSLTAWIGAASAQTLQPADEVLLAAAQDLKGPVPGNRAAIDPREVNTSGIPRSGTFVGLRDAERTRVLAERLGARVRTKGNAITCNEVERWARPQCTLGDLDVVFALSEPTINGDTATVHATVSWMVGSAPKRGVATKDIVLTLIRSESGWRVYGERIKRIT